MIEISINTLAVDAEAPTEEQIEAGAPPLVAMQLVGGSALPLADPNNPQRPVQFPSIAINVPLNKESALSLSKLLAEKAGSLPSAPSGKIIQASSMADVAQVAQVQNGLKG
jgi:hypothetical protein